MIFIERKMGRPTDDPKSFRLEIQLTEDRRAMLDYCAEATGLSRAEIIRRGIDRMYTEITVQEK